MPILPKETDLFPATLFEEVQPMDGASWWVLHTLSRREKELSRRLREMEVPFYCPMIPRKGKSPSGRVRVSHVPLFSGYVFVRADYEVRTHVLMTQLVLKTLEVTEPACLFEDLCRIRALIESQVPLSLESRIQPGQRVRVISGPLLGVEGLVIQRRGTDRLLVSVSFLQQGASVAIEDYQVELI